MFRNKKSFETTDVHLTYNMCIKKSIKYYCFRTEFKPIRFEHNQIVKSLCRKHKQMLLAVAFMYLDHVSSGTPLFASVDVAHTYVAMNSKGDRQPYRRGVKDRRNKVCKTMIDVTPLERHPVLVVA